MTPEWAERIWRIKLSIQGGRALLTRTDGAEQPPTADAVDLVDVIMASADPKARLEPLVMTDVATKRGTRSTTLTLTTACGTGPCPTPIPPGSTFGLQGHLSRASYLYVLLYDEGGRFRVLEPTQRGQVRRADGPIRLGIDRPLMVMPGQSILAVASPRPIEALEDLIGQMIRPEHGGLAQPVRTVLARLALSSLRGAGPSQVLLRTP